jgi:tetratricopeptide (TPR) repeat protein
MQIKCPVPQCGHENPIEALRCVGCGTNLQAYSRLLLMPDDLFNRGLSLAQGGHFQQAEQCLQTALLFNSKDIEATLLLAEVRALQGSEAAASMFERALEKGSSDPRLIKIIATLQGELKAPASNSQAEAGSKEPDQSKTVPSSAFTKQRPKNKRRRR